MSFISCILSWHDQNWKCLVLLSCIRKWHSSLHFHWIIKGEDWQATVCCKVGAAAIVHLRPVLGGCTILPFKLVHCNMNANFTQRCLFHQSIHANGGLRIAVLQMLVKLFSKVDQTQVEIKFPYCLSVRCILQHSFLCTSRSHDN